MLARSSLLLLALAAPLVAQRASPSAPRTVPEATDYAATSRLEDVTAFLAALDDLPHGDRLQRSVAGRSHEGRDLLLVRAALPGVDEQRALRVLVIANIHAGEVEGKEAMQQVLREIALGEHGGLLAQTVLYVLPVYNPDGNERIGPDNRPRQNGPQAVGQRHNGQDLDLNRDFVKAEAPETQALLALMVEHDPHLFLDLHTTDGSWHGYHLTYAPSLSTNQDPAVERLGRALLEEVRTALDADSPSYQVFDYGNFETRDWDGGGAPESAAGRRGWWTYDHRPRYGVNYAGLRGRLGVLSEAYSNCDFGTRIAVTRAFVLQVLRSAVARSDEIRRACAAADAALVAGETTAGAPASFGYDTGFAPPEELPVLVGDCERIPREGGRGVRFRRLDVQQPETMPVFRRFVSKRSLPLPAAWALPAPPEPVLQLLARHGIATERLDAPRRVTAARFAVTSKRKPKRPYQGHQELVLDGSWSAPETLTLPAGTLWVPARQPLARLCAQLLEPQSEDSLSRWNFLEQQTGATFPVVRITATADGDAQRRK